MAIIENEPRASGGPGIEPRWTHSAKDVVGTAYSTASPIWFTASGGVLNEIYYPTIDRPQIRDLQYLVTDGETFFHDVHRNQDTSIEYLGDRGLGVRIINADREGRYRVVMEIITDPHQPCLLVDTRLEGDADLLRRLRLFVLLSPHLNVGGWGNSANVARMAGYEFLTAHKDNTWLALGANVPVRAALLRLRRQDRRMAGPQSQFRARLAVRLGPRRQRCADRGNRPARGLPLHPWPGFRQRPASRGYLSVTSRSGCRSRNTRRASSSNGPAPARTCTRWSDGPATAAIYAAEPANCCSRTRTSASPARSSRR